MLIRSQTGIGGKDQAGNKIGEIEGRKMKKCKQIDKRI
jgi:hypothetical protein